MGTKVNVNGKFQTRPGFYAITKSGVKNPSPNQPSGNILIIDDGIGAGYNSGAGVNGTFKNGEASVVELSNIQEFQGFTKGGELWNLGFPLYKPARGQNGVAKVFLLKAATTVPAESGWTLANGSFTVQTKDEGLSGNGVLDGSNLSRGYADKLVQVNIPTSTATFVTTVTTAPGVAAAQKNTVVAANINIGDVFTIVIAGVTINKTASSTLASELYTQFLTTINANATVIAANLTASVTVNGLEILHSSVNTPFTQTSSVVAAPAKFVYQIWHGTYKGLDSVNNAPYDRIASSDAVATLVIESPVFTTVAELLAWFEANSDFNVGFALKAGSTATGNLEVADASGYNLFAGGTEVYGSTDFDSAIAAINNLDFTHILATKSGADAASLNNTKLWDFVEEDSKYERLLVVAGGYDKSSFANGSASSAATTLFYNSDKVVVVHGGIKKTKRGGSGFNVYNQLYKAAQILGRCAGLPSQVPVTLKSIDIDAEVHPLSDTEQEFAIKYGIMYSYYDHELKGFVAGQGITSLQNNEYLINEDNTTFNWALKRIQAELNKGLMVAGKIRFFGGNTGGNRNTTSPEDVVSWATGYLKDKTATNLEDNLILKATEIEASINQDNLFLNYKFVGNTEITKILATGTLIEG
jgi:hypothetical protein